NPGPVTVGGFELYDAAEQAGPERESGNYVAHDRALILSPDLITHVVVRLDPIQTLLGNRMLDLSRLLKVALIIPACEKGEPPISISTLRLCKEHDVPDETARVQPGDAIIVIRHLDISCFIYEPERYAESEEIATLDRELTAEVALLRRAI